MLDQKTLTFLEKIAAEDSSGSSQLKKKYSRHHEKYPAAGMGIGGLMGLATGHLAGVPGRLGTLARIAGLAAGATIGKKVGEYGTSSHSVTTEGTVKKQQKSKGPESQPKVPSLNDAAVLKLLKGHK